MVICGVVIDSGEHCDLLEPASGALPQPMTFKTVKSHIIISGRGWNCEGE